MSPKQSRKFRAVRSPDTDQARPARFAPTGSETRGRQALFLVLLLASTLAAYYPAWHGGMLWDDDYHVTRSELQSAEGLKRIWFDIGATQQYYPATHSAFWLQHKIWGDDTLGYHLVSIMLHGLSAFLIAVILRRLAVPGWWLAAVIFALHPIQVESVAWISEQKNTLSGVFYLGAALAYLQFDQNRQKWRYACALGLFLFALSSKTVTATLPAALLVVFWWQRGRLSWTRDVLPLLPWFVLGTSAGLLTAWVERSMIGAQGAPYQFSLIERGLIAGRVIWFYLGKLFWPAHLVFIYPRWQISQDHGWLYVFPLGAALLLICLWRIRRRSRAPLAALLLFCGTLFPALGFFNVYPFRYSFVADHFQYLASISILALFSAGLVKLSVRWQLASVRVMATGTAVLGCMLALPTWSQSRQYVDAETLYRTTISRNPSCWMAHTNLSGVLLDTRIDEALWHAREALRIKPDHAPALNNLGLALQKLGHFEEAQASFTEVLKVNPQYSQAHNNLGYLLQVQGHLEDAEVHYRAALELSRNYPEAHYNLGNVLQLTGRMEQAVEQYRETLRFLPGFAPAHYNLGLALQRLGRHEEAAKEYQQVLRLQPDLAEAYLYLGLATEELGHIEEARDLYREALRLKPTLEEARIHLNRVLARIR
jgi:protein O-mannosyl-transferase